MKKLALVLIIASLLIPGVAAQAEPFVADGRIQMQIVADTPQDIILGSQVAQYLQQFADETRQGLGVTPQEIELDQDAYILIGAPEDNSAVREALGDREVSGATLAFVDDDFIITGRTGMQVETAAQEFLQGTRSMGGFVDDTHQAPATTNKTDRDEIDEVVDTNRSINASANTSTRAERSAAPPTQNTSEPEACEPTTFCDGDVKKQRSADCSEQSVRYCGNGCYQGACKQGFFSKIWDALSFWN